MTASVGLVIGSCFFMRALQNKDGVNRGKAVPSLCVVTRCTRAGVASRGLWTLQSRDLFPFLQQDLSSETL